MTTDDDDRTVFGQRLPQPPQEGQPSQPPQGAGGERTIFGMPIPGSAGGQPQTSPAPPPPPPYGQPGHPPQRDGYAPPLPMTPPGVPPAGHPVAQQAPHMSPYAQPHPNPPASQYPAPPSQAPGPTGEQEDTWFGGKLPPQRPAQPAVATPPSGYSGQAVPPYVPQQPQPQPGYVPPPSAASPNWAQGQAAGWSPYNAPQNPQFPDAHAAQQTAAKQATPEVKIPFADAVRGSGLNIGHTSNPILAAATDLLVLLGRLRTGIVEMHAVPLRDHVVREIHGFVQKAQDHGVVPEDIDVARYALAATADDIVQTIPGSEPGYWQQYSMAAELLNDRSAGIGFFARLEHVMGLSHQRKDLLELMLTCLALGFEGKYRADPNGMVALTRMRNEIYQRFRAVEARPGHDLSVHWMPVLLGGRRNTALIPLWIFGGIAAAMVVALFATLSGVLSSDTQVSQDAILALTDPTEEIALETAANFVAAEPYEAAAPPQLERIRGVLDREITEALVNVETKGDYIAIRVGSQLRFKSGSADLSSDFSDLASRLGLVLEAETGDVVVEGHSDNIPLSGRGRYRTNEELSQARAETVLGLLAESISDPSRLSAVGVGPNDPLDTANTPEARARNRRVEILIEREERL